MLLKKRAVSTLKLVDQITYLSSNISFTESDVKICQVKVWNAIDRLLIICKSDLSHKIKQDFCQALVVSIQLSGCTIWMLTKHMKEKLDGNYTRMFCAVVNKSWKQYPTTLQLDGHLPPISQTIKVKWTRHLRHCWEGKDELESNVPMDTCT